MANDTLASVPIILPAPSDLATHASHPTQFIFDYYAERRRLRDLASSSVTDTWRHSDHCEAQAPHPQEQKVAQLENSEANRLLAPTRMASRAKQAEAWSPFRMSLGDSCVGEPPSMDIKMPEAQTQCSLMSVQGNSSALELEAQLRELLHSFDQRRLEISHRFLQEDIDISNTRQLVEHATSCNKSSQTSYTSMAHVAPRTLAPPAVVQLLRKSRSAPELAQSLPSKATRDSHRYVPEDATPRQTVYSRLASAGQKTGPVDVPGIGLVEGAISVARLLLPRLSSSVVGRSSSTIPTKLHSTTPSPHP